MSGQAPFFIGSEFTSVPGLLHFRFWAQFIDMGAFAWPKDEFGQRLMPFVESVLPELSYVHEKRERLIAAVAAYKAGVAEGRLFKVNERGQTDHDRSMEKEISDLVKDFFIHLKLCIDNTFSSGILSDSDFNAESFHKCDADKRLARKDEYLRSKDGRYAPVIELIIRANDQLLVRLKQIRGAFEHKAFSLDPFQVDKGPDGHFVTEPSLDGRPLLITIDKYYEEIFNLIEKLIAYFIGINVECKHAGFELQVGREVDYLNSKNRFIIAPAGARMWYPTDKGLYD